MIRSRKTALALACMIPLGAHAELQTLDDNTLGTLTGQAGITIELNQASVSIGEVAYRDEGFISISGVEIGGDTLFDGADNSSNYLDDIVLHVDVAGATPGLGAANLGLADMGATVTGSANETAVAVGNGDLVISLRPKAGTTIDFGMGISKVALAGSGYASNLGDIQSEIDAGGATVLMQDMKMTGKIGLVDIVVKNDNSGVNINAYFNNQGEVVRPFLNSRENFRLHNSRGADRIEVGAESYAHAQLQISQGVTSGGADALALNIQDLSGDMDSTNITYGSQPAIGNVYTTDFRLSAETVIYGH